MGNQSIRPFSPQGDVFSSETSHTRKIVCTQGESYRHTTTIGILTDDALLDIFDFYRKNHNYSLRLVWEWHVPAHVCRRWRQIIFESPHRLKIQILCTHKTPVPENLGIWPTFPIVIEYNCNYSGRSITPGNVIAALGHPDRARHVRLHVTGSQLAKMAAVMLEPFPVLTDLYILSRDRSAPVLTAKFLGGSAPCLRQIGLCGIPYPALPTLLLSANGLVALKLRSIPPTGYISPDAMVAGLAALTRLETLIIAFESATPRPDQIFPPPVTRIVLPALTSFTFHGACEYLENFTAQIDCPQLDWVYIHYLNQFGDVPVVQLSKFVRRSVGPKLTQFRVSFFSDFISFSMDRHANHPSSDWHPPRAILCEGSGWQVSSIAKLLGQFSATEILSNVVHLKLEAEPKDDYLLEGMDDVEWLHLLYQFSTVQTLHVSQELAGYVALALEDIKEEAATKVLPSLNLIYLAGQSASSLGKFVASRGLSDCPVTVVDTITEFCKRLDLEASVKFYTRYILYSLVFYIQWF